MFHNYKGYLSSLVSISIYSFNVFFFPMTLVYPRSLTQCQLNPHISKNGKMIRALQRGGSMLDAKEVLSPHCEYNVSLQLFTFSPEISIQSANRLSCQIYFFPRVLSDMNLRAISPTFGDLLDLKTL